MTLLIIIVAAVVFVSLHAFGKFTTAIAFISFQVLFNAYSYLLAFLFLPSNVPVSLSIADFEQESLTLTDHMD